jgi:hypothetical protein
MKASSSGTHFPAVGRPSPVVTNDVAADTLLIFAYYLLSLACSPRRSREPTGHIELAPVAARSLSE